MYWRTFFIGLLLVVYVPAARADKLQAAARGKKQLVQTLYGTLASFDGTTLIFEEPLPPGVDSRTPNDHILGGPQTMSAPIPVKDTEIVITLGARNPQEPVDAYHPEYSTPGARKTLDVGLQQANLEKAQLEKEKNRSSNATVELDLTHCSGPYIDQVVENDPQVSGATKQPVSGNLQGIVNGVVTIKRLPDGAILKYRLDALNEIKIGMCH